MEHQCLQRGRHGSIEEETCRRTTGPFGVQVQYVVKRLLELVNGLARRRELQSWQCLLLSP